MIFTATGKLGDLIYALPIGAWYWRTRGERVHWVLTETFAPFRAVVSLLAAQAMTERVSLVPHVVKHWGCGGQPYRFDPARYGVAGPYVNLGFRHYPDRYITEFFASEHGFGWDADWTLDLGDVDATEEVVATEHVRLPHARTLDLSRPVLDNARRMKAARERHCGHSAMAVIMWHARVPFTLYHTTDEAKRFGLFFPLHARSDVRRVETA